MLNNPLIECQSINKNFTPTKNIYKKKVFTKKNEALLFENKLNKKNLQKDYFEKHKIMNEFSERRTINADNNYNYLINIRNDIINPIMNLKKSIYKNGFGNINKRREERNNKSSSNSKNHYNYFNLLMDTKKKFYNGRNSNYYRFKYNQYSKYIDKTNKEKIEYKNNCISRDKYGVNMKTIEI